LMLFLDRFEHFLRRRHLARDLFLLSPGILGLHGAEFRRPTVSAFMAARRSHSAFRYKRYL